MRTRSCELGTIPGGGVSGTVIPFPPRRPPAPVPAAEPRRPKGCAVVLSAERGRVSLVIDSVELELSPAQARDLGMDLVALARVAEASRV